MSNDFDPLNFRIFYLIHEDTACVTRNATWQQEIKDGEYETAEEAWKVLFETLYKASTAAVEHEVQLQHKCRSAIMESVRAEDRIMKAMDNKESCLWGCE